jgi:hypothetical protein
MNLAAGTYHWTIREDATLDVYKRSRESNEVFLTSTEQITHFIDQRRAFAQRTLPQLSPGLAQPVVLNEIVTNNVSGIRDEASEFDEWIELFNRGTTPYVLTGHSLAADPRTGMKWRFPAGTTIPPQGHLLVWVDGQPAQGPLHTPFALNAAGGSVSLFGPASSGTPLLDVIAYRALRRMFPSVAVSAGPACGESRRQRRGEEIFRIMRPVRVFHSQRLGGCGWPASPPRAQPVPAADR